MAAVPSIGRAAKVERPAVPSCDATRDLFERFSAQIMGYCLHQLGSREEAEDAVQTTFMNAFRGLQRGIVPQVESAWLFKIAHNVCLSRRRSTWRRGRIEAPNNLEVLQEVVPAREQIDDDLIRLPEVLEGMPESQRRAILLREWQGLSYREIADELRLSQSAVETLIFRARRALAAGLEVEPQRKSWRRRARHGIDAGGVLAALKALFTGGTALKVAATVAVATTAAVAVTGGQHHGHHQKAHRSRKITPTPSAPSATGFTHARTPAIQQRTAPRRHASAPVKHWRARRPANVVAHSRRPVVARDETTPPVSAPAAAAPAKQPSSAAGNADPPKHDEPATAEGESSAAAATDTGKGHAKQPPTHDVQSSSDPAPTADDSETHGQGQDGGDDGGSQKGNGDGEGNGDK